MTGKRMARPTCESCVSIDVRRWHREGRLHSGQHFSCSWTYAGKPFGSISVRTEEDTLVLVFHSRNSQDSDWKPVEQRVPIIWTACHLGGRRAWFRCATYSDGRYCGRRVCSTALVTYSHVGGVTAWPMLAGKRRPCTAAFIGRKRSGCGSVAMGTYVSRSRKTQADALADVFSSSRSRLRLGSKHSGCAGASAFMPFPVEVAVAAAPVTEAAVRGAATADAAMADAATAAGVREEPPLAPVRACARNRDESAFAGLSPASPCTSSARGAIGGRSGSTQ
jgi:hypothetical protein